MYRYGSNGFSLIELIAIIVVLGVLAVVTASQFVGNASAQLQASRDSIVAALLSAQQLAMAQTDPVQVSVSGSSVDVRRDAGTGFGSINVGGVQYPLDISPVSLDGPTVTVGYDRLGRTLSGTDTSIPLKVGDSTVAVTVSPSGFSQ